MDAARRWLAEDGVTQVHGGEWTDGANTGQFLSADEVAHTWAGAVFTDERLDVHGQLHLAFGLLDLLNEYWVTCEIRCADQGADGPLPADALWDGYRRRLEGSQSADVLTYSLWVDWFEDHHTSATAFAEVLGRDVERLPSGAPAPLLRRARRVLECSGPVPWAAKEATYVSAARLPVLQPALLKALLGCYHDVHGTIEPSAALALLGQLDLPADTEHLEELRTVLSAGHTNHYRDPQAWTAAVSARP